MNKTIKTCLINLIAGSFVIIVAGTGSAEVYPGPSLSDHKGVIDNIKYIIVDRMITIEDTAYRLSPAVKFHRPDSPNCSWKWFKKNDIVYYAFEPETNIIKTIWHVNCKINGKP